MSSSFLGEVALLMPGIKGDCFKLTGTQQQITNGHIELLSSWDTAAEEHTRCHFYHLRKRK